MGSINLFGVVESAEEIERLSEACLAQAVVLWPFKRRIMRSKSGNGHHVTSPFFGEMIETDEFQIGRVDKKCSKRW